MPRWCVERAIGAFDGFGEPLSGGQPIRTGEGEILDALHLGEGVVGHFDAESGVLVTERVLAVQVARAEAAVFYKGEADETTHFMAEALHGIFDGLKEVFGFQVHELDAQAEFDFFNVHVD